MELESPPSPGVSAALKLSLIHIWPMPRKALMNRSDAAIVSTFNSEIRGLYNVYRIAENVGAFHKYYYMVRYSMLKTLAGKHRTNAVSYTHLDVYKRQIEKVVINNNARWTHCVIK